MYAANAVRKVFGHSLLAPLVLSIMRNYWFPEFRGRLRLAVLALYHTWGLVNWFVKV